MLSNKASQVLIATLLKSDRETLSSLLEILNVTGWPSLDIVKLGVNQALNNLTAYSTVNRSEKSDENKNAIDPLWENFVLQSHFTLDICPPPFFKHMLYNGHILTIQQFLKNTSPPALKAWLQAKDLDSMFNDSGRDKCSNLGVLVQNGSVEVVKTLVALDSQYVQQRDHKDRSALFYARNTQMVSYLSSQKVDASLKDKDGNDVVQVWNEVLKTPLASEWVGALSQIDPSSRVVQKILSMQLGTLDNAEEVLLNTMVQNNTPWQGVLFGCEKSWNLPEVWDFAIVLHATGLLKSKNSPPSYYGNTDTFIRKKPKEFAALLDQQKAYLPAKFQQQIEQKSSHSLALQWIISLCKNWDGNPKRLIEIDAEYEKNAQSYYSSRDYAAPYLTGLDKILEGSSDTDRQMFAACLSSYTSLTDLWGSPNVAQRFVQSKGMFVLPVEKGGVLTDQLASSIAFLRLNQGLRTENAASAWLLNFKNYVVPLWNEDVSQGKNLQIWSPVLQLGLSYSPLSLESASALKNPFNQTLQEMLMKNVEIEKIPLRFAKHMPDDLRSAASRWIINKTLSTKVKGKEEEPAPRRRM